MTKLVRYPHYCAICKWSSMVTTNPIYICIFASCIVISPWTDIFQIYILDNAYYPTIWPCKQMNGDGNHNKTRLCVHKGEWYRIQHHVHSFSMFGNAGTVSKRNTSLIIILTMTITYSDMFSAEFIWLSVLSNIIKVATNVKYSWEIESWNQLKNDSHIRTIY